VPPIAIRPGSSHSLPAGRSNLIIMPDADGPRLSRLFFSSRLIAQSVIKRLNMMARGIYNESHFGRKHQGSLRR